MIELMGEEFLKELRHLQLVSRYEFAGLRVGERRTRRRGSSVEFDDYKEYDSGDDIRFIDWNLWARLDKFYIKLFASEENLNVFFIFDLSRSMDFGKSSKWDFQLRFVASIAYLALSNHDSVYLYPFGGDLIRTAPQCHYPVDYRLIVKFLQDLKPDYQADLEKSINQFLGHEKRRGILFVISDCFYDLDCFDRILRKLRWYKFDTTLIQIMAEEERAPAFHGSSRLIDSETNQFMEMDMSLTYLDQYQEICEGHTRDLRALCGKYGFQFSCAQSHFAIRDFVVSILRKGSRS